jgi:hypothetical protein
MRAALPPVLAILALSLAACATGTSAPPPAPPSSSPTPIEEHDWFFSSEDDHASLAYGLANSDDVWLGLSCGRGAGRLEMIRPVEVGHPVSISLESGGDTETYPAAAHPSDLHEGPVLTAGASTGDPVFQRFRRVGWLAVYGADYRIPMAPHPQSAPHIERFFTFCG